MSAQQEPHRIDLAKLAKTSLDNSAPTYLSEGVHVDPEIVVGHQVFQQGQATVFFYKGSAQHSQATPWMFYPDVTTVFSQHGSKTDPNESIRALSQRLCEDHPAISTYEGIFGGGPHLNGLRISVADILEQLYLSGSIAAVQEMYSPDLSEDQIKEAIAYAQDFLESAVSSSS